MPSVGLASNLHGALGEMRTRTRERTRIHRGRLARCGLLGGLILLLLWAALPPSTSARTRRPAARRTVMLIPVPSAGDGSIAQYRFRIVSGGGARVRRQRIKLTVLNARQLPKTVTVVGSAGRRTVKGHREIVISLAALTRRSTAGRTAATAPRYIQVTASATPRVVVSFLGGYAHKNVRAHPRGRSAGANPPPDIPSELEGFTYLLNGLPASAADVEDALYDIYYGAPGHEVTMVVEILDGQVYRVDVVITCHFFDPVEEECDGDVLGTNYSRAAGSAHAADTRNPVDALRIVVPGRGITNFLCPTQLPHGSLTTTTAPNDTLLCDGGSLPLDQAFKYNLRTSPSPTAGMGGQAFVRQDGAFKGPFTVHGP